MRPSFFHHLHPPTIPAPQARWRYTLGAGGLSVYFVLVLLVTGALEMFFYIPTPEEAAPSIQTITYLVPYGWLVRNLHYWAAQGLTVAAVVHLLRVVLTGAYVPPRRFNYWLGLALLVLTLMLSFSGYVLRWDEGIRWALVAGTNLLKTIPILGDGLYAIVVGGDEPGPATLIRFYAWHIFGLTLLLVVVGVWHLFRVRRDGGIAAPPPAHRTDPSRITRAQLVRREVLAAFFASIVLIGLAILFPAPIGPALGRDVPPERLYADARAPWFFLWVQRLLRWGDPFWMGIFIPLIILIVLTLLPYLFANIPPMELGRWLPPRGRRAQLVTAAIFLGLVVLTMLEWFKL